MVLCFWGSPTGNALSLAAQLRNPGDEMVLETAVDGQARAIVTFNRRDYGEAPGRFGIDVLSPAKRWGGPTHDDEDQHLSASASPVAESRGRKAEQAGRDQRQSVRGDGGGGEVSAMTTADYFAERKARADMDAFSTESSSTGEPPLPRRRAAEGLTSTDHRRDFAMAMKNGVTPARSSGTSAWSRGGF